MKMNNPYSLTFGRMPNELIFRSEPTRSIIDSFLAEKPSQQIYMITGIRGCGKTVFMTDIAKNIKNYSEWIVVELNPEKDLLLSLASKLSSENWLAQIFRRSKINLSFWGLGIEIEGTPPITDIETALSKMLEAINKQGKRLLITIDEVTNTPNMKVFTSAFQIFLRQDLPVYLLMTGLYNNIDALQNEDSLTFLHRAPKIELKPLSISAIATNYQRVFKLDRKSAISMAQKTKGYPFAFQVLGYFTWEHSKDQTKATAAYRQYLEEYVYEKVWSELPEGEKRILYALANHPEGKVQDIREAIGIGSNKFSPYRKRLIRRGLINGNEWGRISFTLPFFDIYITDNYGLE